MLEPKNYARYGAARDAVLQMLHEGEIEEGSGGNKLPSEGELSRRIGVSTGTIREALRMLEMEGIVSKKHGTGNFFHRSALELRMRIDIISDYRRLLEESGYTVSISQFGHLFREADEREREVFGIQEPILAYDQIYLADGNNAIFTRNLVPRSLLKGDLEDVKQDGSLMELLWNRCQSRIAHSIEEIIPREASAEEAEVYGIRAGRPVIGMDQIFYSFRDEAIGYAMVSFHPEIVKMHMLRKWS